MTDRRSDLVPQGSIPQVLALRELLAEMWRAHRDPVEDEYNQCDSAPCQWCTETKRHIDSLLTALRSLASPEHDKTTEEG